MGKKSVSRITISIPTSTVSNLDFVSKSLGVSRSAFVSAFLDDLLPPLIPLVKMVEKGATEGDSRRYRGDFAEQLQGMVSRLNSDIEGLQDDLFKE